MSIDLSPGSVTLLPPETKTSFLVDPDVVADALSVASKCLKGQYVGSSKVRFALVILERGGFDFAVKSLSLSCIDDPE